MKRHPFFALVKMLRDNRLLEDIIHTTVEEHVGMFLHMVCHIERFKVIHNIFRRSMETISCCFSPMLYAIVDALFLREYLYIFYSWLDMSQYGPEA
jgi:hypothetical protein